MEMVLLSRSPSLGVLLRAAPFFCSLGLLGKFCSSGRRRLGSGTGGSNVRARQNRAAVHFSPKCHQKQFRTVLIENTSAKERSSGKWRTRRRRRSGGGEKNSAKILAKNKMIYSFNLSFCVRATISLRIQLYAPARTYKCTSLARRLTRGRSEARAPPREEFAGCEFAC